MTLLARGFLLFVILSQVTACASPPQRTEPNPSLVPELKKVISENTQPLLDFTDDLLRSDGMSDEFIQNIHKLYIVKNKDWQERAARIVELNIFGFLGQSNYALHDSPLAQKKIKRYLKDHAQTFRMAHQKYAVSSPAIASLLWVETKYGKVLGTFPLPFVFYAMAMGSHSQMIHAMIKLIPEKMAKGNPKGITPEAAEEKVIDRCKSKAGWALEELKAVKTIQNQHYFNPFSQKASFAGAFGLPQFIPSTYLKLAISEFRTKPNLSRHSDAILSIAHFLISNGWKDKDPEAEAAALFSYNRSKDYGAVILKLAHEVSSHE
jgi:membrane-bound lytic murein transglycosylase B